MRVTHEYYITPTIDGAKMVQDAQMRVDNSKKHAKAEDNVVIAVIHYHAHGLTCGDQCREIA